jgi:hypothetical protein
LCGPWERILPVFANSLYYKELGIIQNADSTFNSPHLQIYFFVPQGIGENKGLKGHKRA